MVFLMVSLCYGTAQATMFLLVSVCCDTAQAMVFLLATQAMVFLLVSLPCDTAPAMVFLLVSLRDTAQAMVPLLMSLRCDTAQAKADPASRQNATLYRSAKRSFLQGTVICVQPRRTQFMDGGLRCVCSFPKGAVSSVSLTPGR